MEFDRKRRVLFESASQLVAESVVVVLRVGRKRFGIRLRNGLSAPLLAQPVNQLLRLLNCSRSGRLCEFFTPFDQKGADDADDWANYTIRMGTLGCHGYTLVKSKGFPLRNVEASYSTTAPNLTPLFPMCISAVPTANGVDRPSSAPMRFRPTKYLFYGAASCSGDRCSPYHASRHTRIPAGPSLRATHPDPVL